MLSKLSPPGVSNSLTGSAKPKPSATEPDVYAFTIYHSVMGNLLESKESEQKKVDEFIQGIMRDHDYKDFKILKVDSARLIKNEDVYTVKFFRAKQAS